MQVHAPLTGSQTPPFSHWQSNVHPCPYLPMLHTENKHSFRKRTHGKHFKDVLVLVIDTVHRTRISSCLTGGATYTCAALSKISYGLYMYLFQSVRFRDYNCLRRRCLHQAITKKVVCLTALLEDTNGGGPVTGLGVTIKGVLHTAVLLCKKQNLSFNSLP